MSGPGEGSFAPLRVGAFRSMWTAQLVSNLGGWMQTVGAQWLMLSLTSSATFLALIQSAASLPVLLFAIPAGAIGDLVDRRRLLLISEASMLLASVALAVLAATGEISRWSLLALLFAVGIGQAWTAPTWQSLQPELVDAEQRPQAIALGAVNQNLARAVGPALGGLLVAATEPSIAFLANAVTFLAVIAAIARWRERPRAATAVTATLPREHVGAAMRASGRYVANSPALRAVLVRCGWLIVFASALWALLPAVASQDLGLGSGGYGLLLGCVGAGAVGGAFALPRLRRSTTPDRILLGASLALAAATGVLAGVHVTAVVAAAMVVAGVGWILALATLNSTYQALLPGWVKARALAYYLIVFQGGMAIGSAVLGILAGAVGIPEVLGGCAVLLAVGPLVTRRWPIPAIAPSELLPAGEVPGAHAPRHASADGDAGPILVEVRYRAAPGGADALAAAVLGLRRMRRRTGASAWSCWVDPDDPTTVLEQFVVATRTDHERQLARMTVRDRERVDAARRASVDVTTAHWRQATVT